MVGSTASNRRDARNPITFYSRMTGFDRWNRPEPWKT